MGMNLVIHVGPYLRCPNPEVETTSKRKTCTNMSCSEMSKYLSTAHCAVCGAKVDTVSVPDTRPLVDDDPVRGKIKERLTVFKDYCNGETFKGVDIWVSNMSSVKGLPDHDLDNFTGEDSIGADGPAKEMAAFEKAFAKEIAIIREAYAVGPTEVGDVEVRWGILGGVR